MVFTFEKLLVVASQIFMLCVELLLIYFLQPRHKCTAHSPNQGCKFKPLSHWRHHLTKRSIVVVVLLFNITSALLGYISDMNYSRKDSHNRDKVPYFFRMIGEGL